MSVLSTILWFLIAIGILVVVHEFGHYLAALVPGVAPPLARCDLQ
mgnify:CR=1 FL=1